MRPLFELPAPHNQLYGPSRRFRPFGTDTALSTSVPQLEGFERTFNKKRMNGSLNKNRVGSPCYGRYGVYVRTKY
jgi:hypothetical protein